MPLRPLRDDKSLDLLVREATALDIDERSRRNATMNQAGKISLGGPKDLSATQFFPKDRLYYRLVRWH
jgi:hypothetical protein